MGKRDYSLGLLRAAAEKRGGSVVRQGDTVEVHAPVGFLWRHSGLPVIEVSLDRDLSHEERQENLKLAYRSIKEGRVYDEYLFDDDDDRGDAYDYPDTYYDLPHGYQPLNSHFGFPTPGRG